MSQEPNYTLEEVEQMIAPLYNTAAQENRQRLDRELADELTARSTRRPCSQCGYPKEAQHPGSTTYVCPNCNPRES